MQALSAKISLEYSVSILRAAGEPTRLRLLALLSQYDLTVSDLVDILGQSQPRISRHLKLLSEAGLLERYQEGAWANFRMVDQGPGQDMLEVLIARLDRTDPQIERDFERLNTVREKRAAEAAEYFSSNASDWDKIRSLYVDENQVEAAMLAMIGNEKNSAMLDLGTGTGRVLELFSHLYDKGVGIDASRDMLSIARARLDKAGLSRVQTRHGDLYHLPTAPGSFDIVTIHQVLHYLQDPGGAIREAGKALARGGRLLVVDFAPHDMEFLREDHAHMRMGFSEKQMQDWMKDAGLRSVTSQHLEPDTSSTNKSQKITVGLWLGHKS